MGSSQSKTNKQYIAEATQGIANLRLALENGLEVDRPDSEGNYLIFEAVKKDLSSATKMLIAWEADVNIKWVNGLTPLHICKSYKCAKLLLDSGAKVTYDIRGMSPLQRSIYQRETDIDLFELLLEHDKDIEHKDNDGETALDMAVSKNRVDLAKILIDKGARARPEMIGEAWSKNAWSMIDLLVKSGCETSSYEDENGNNALNLVSDEPISEETFDIILKNTDDVNKQNKNGLTALHYVCKKGKTVRARKLLARGAKVKIMTYQGHDALDFCIDDETGKLIIGALEAEDNAWKERIMRLERMVGSATQGYEVVDRPA